MPDICCPRTIRQAVLALSLGVAIVPARAADPISRLLPGVGLNDRRDRVDPSEMPWRAIGRVQTELGGRCTGTLIAPAVVATAAHCLYLPRPGRFVQPGSVHFLLGYDQGRFAAHSRVSAYVIGPGYDPTRAGFTAGLDWALLTLGDPVTVPDRIAVVSAAPLAPDTLAELGGYGRDRAEVIDADTHCVVVGRVADGGGRALLRHTCSGTFGTSGAPIWARTADGSWSVVGIQIAATAGASGGLAVPWASVIGAPARR